MYFERADADPASRETVHKGEAATDTMAVACTEALPPTSGRSFKRLQVLPVCVNNRETNKYRKTLCL